MTSQLHYFVCGPTLHQIGMVACHHSYVAAWLGQQKLLYEIPREVLLKGAVCNTFYTSRFCKESLMLSICGYLSGGSRGWMGVAKWQYRIRATLIFSIFTF